MNNSQKFHFSLATNIINTTYEAHTINTVMGRIETGLLKVMKELFRHFLSVCVHKIIQHFLFTDITITKNKYDSGYTVLFTFCFR